MLDKLAIESVCFWYTDKDYVNDLPPASLSSHFSSFYFCVLPLWSITLITFYSFLQSTYDNQLLHAEGCIWSVAPPAKPCRTSISWTLRLHIRPHRSGLGRLTGRRNLAQKGCRGFWEAMIKTAKSFSGWFHPHYTIRSIGPSLGFLISFGKD